MKALREKNQRREVDPDLYASAADVAKELRVWRASRESRALHKRQLILACFVALLLAIPAGFGWVKYWGEIRATTPDKSPPCAFKKRGYPRVIMTLFGAQGEGRCNGDGTQTRHRTHGVSPRG